jgi:hypothetical protein
MSVLPQVSIYAEITAAQLLRPRMDLLTKEGGLDYKELNNRICANNRTEDIPVDHNPIYGGISKEVCGVERQESFTISDKLLSFDELGYTISPRKVVVKTSESTIVSYDSSTEKFKDDPITVDVSALLDSIKMTARKASGEVVDGTLAIDNTKLIIDESIKNPFRIDFSDMDNITLKINPNAGNVIPLIFTPIDKKLRSSFTSVQILVIDERVEAVIPEVKDGTIIKVTELNADNATSCKGLKGEIKDNTSAKLEVTIEGGLIDPRTHENFETEPTCEVAIGTAFPENPTAYVGQGNDVEIKLHNTLFASVTFKHNDIRPLTIVLPIVYEADERDEATAVSDFQFAQSAPVELTYENTGNTFRGDAAVLDASNITATATGTTPIIGDVVVEKALNLNQSSSIAHVTVSFDEDTALNSMKFEVEIVDNRPFKAKENWIVSDSGSNLAATIDVTVPMAGAKGSEWDGDSLSVSGSVTKIQNQFGRVIQNEIVAVSGIPFNLTENSLHIGNYQLHILAKEGGSEEAESVAYVLLDDMTQIEVKVTVAVTDNR